MSASGSSGRAIESGADGGGGVIVVRSEAGLRCLEAHLFDPREDAVVALTRSLETEGPVLAPDNVRALVGAAPRIYFIAEERLLLRLQHTLGGALGPPLVGARVWWPGLSARSNPGDHPLVLALDEEPQESLLAEFTRQFDLSRPDVRREIGLIEDTRALAEYELAQAQKQLRSSGERELSEMGFQARLHTLITREWVRALSDAQRLEHPLCGYVLTAEFIATAERHVEHGQERLAWLCAMLACGYAPALAAIAPEPPRLLFARDSPEQGAATHGWSCELERDAPASPRLHYWTRQDGTIEFTRIVSRHVPEAAWQTPIMPRRAALN